MFQNSWAPEIWCKERQTAVHDTNPAGTLKEKMVEATKSWRWEEICKITSLSACIFSLRSTSASGHRQWQARGRGSFGPTQNGFCHCSVHEGHQHKCGYWSTPVLLQEGSERCWECEQSRPPFPADFPWTLALRSTTQPTLLPKSPHPWQEIPVLATGLWEELQSFCGLHQQKERVWGRIFRDRRNH